MTGRQASSSTASASPPTTSRAKQAIWGFLWRRVPAPWRSRRLGAGAGALLALAVATTGLLAGVWQRAPAAICRHAALQVAVRGLPQTAGGHVADECTCRVVGSLVGGDGPTSGARLLPAVPLGASFTVSCCVRLPPPAELAGRKVLAVAKSLSGAHGLLLLSLYDRGVGLFEGEMRTAPGAWATGDEAWHHLVAWGRPASPAEGSRVSLALDGREVLSDAPWRGADLGRVAGDWDARRPQGLGPSRFSRLRVFNSTPLEQLGPC